MPLESGSSKEVISKNIATEREHGKPEKQAVAIAFRKSREDAVNAICDSMARLSDRIDEWTPEQRERYRDKHGGSGFGGEGRREGKVQMGRLASGEPIKNNEDAIRGVFHPASKSAKRGAKGLFNAHRRGDAAAKIDAICDSIAHLNERVDAYGKRRADAGPREENFQRANKASENREKEERDKKLEQLGRAFGRSRGDEEEARDDAYDSVDGGSMELLSKMRTDAARADFDPFTITMATIAGWSLYEIVQNIRQFRSLGKHNKEMQDLIDRLETEKKKRETRGDDHRVIGGVKLGDDDPLAALKKEIASEKDPKRQSELKKQLDKRQRDLDIAQMKRESRNGRGAG